MISIVSGKVLEKNVQSVVIDVAGVGYEVFLSEKDFSKLQIEDQVSIFTKLVVSKDFDFTLYGFSAKPTKNMFNMLCTVNGVGPKSAFNIINYGDIKDLSEAISNADKNYFKAVSGVGPKLAMKIILELQDKIGKNKELQISAGLSPQEKDIIQAVSSMGYNAKLAEEILSSVDVKLSESEKINLIIKKLSSD